MEKKQDSAVPAILGILIALGFGDWWAIDALVRAIKVDAPWYVFALMGSTAVTMTIWLSVNFYFHFNPRIAKEESQPEG